MAKNGTTGVGMMKGLDMQRKKKKRGSFLVLFTISLALPLTFSAFDFLNEIIELLILSAWILGVQIPILMRMFFSLNTKDNHE